MYFRSLSIQFYWSEVQYLACGRMSLDVHLQAFKCLSSFEAGILWLGLIGQCTSFELLTFNSIREKTNIMKPTAEISKMFTQVNHDLTHAACTQLVWSMLASFEVALPKIAPIHTFFIRFSFLHFNWHNTLSISCALRLKNEENSRTHCSLSAILDSLLLGIGTSLPYLGTIGHILWEGKILCELLFRNVSWETAST